MFGEGFKGTRRSISDLKRCQKGQSRKNRIMAISASSSWEQEKQGVRDLILGEEKTHRSPYSIGGVKWYEVHGTGRGVCEERGAY